MRASSITPISPFPSGSGAKGLPDVYILAQIAQLYGITVSNLIGEEEPPKKSNPHFHIYVVLLSVALVFVIAAILFTAFTIAAVPFPSWLFFLYAVPVSSIVCIVFTSLWWGILMQGLSITALIWSAGLCIYLSIPSIPYLKLIFVVCAAVQVLITLWELFRYLQNKNMVLKRTFRARRRTLQISEHRFSRHQQWQALSAPKI